MQAYAGCMIKYQPLFILGIDKDNQELTKESAFGAMGMFIFLFSISTIYLCLQKRRDTERMIQSQGYIRPPQPQGGGIIGRRNQMFVELPVANSFDDDNELEFQSNYRDSPPPSTSNLFNEDDDDENENEMVSTTQESSLPHPPIDLLS
jgi:hypothetical protein